MGKLKTHTQVAAQRMPFVIATPAFVPRYIHESRVVSTGFLLAKHTVSAAPRSC